MEQLGIPCENLENKQDSLWCVDLTEQFVGLILTEPQVLKECSLRECCSHGLEKWPQSVLQDYHSKFLARGPLTTVLCRNVSMTSMSPKSVSQSVHQGFLA